ncbi:MAG: crossover junction endodeoxyribonuclease RuvC [Minisyncoccia bacterium]
MKVLAFDPGYERLGVAVLKREHGKETLLHSDCLRTPKALPFHERLKQLGESVERLMHEHAPDCVALEKVYFEKNAKTAMQIAEVRGMLAYLALARGIKLCEYTPLEVKAAITGYGKSDKSAIALMVPRLIALPDKKMIDDEMDAIAIGLTCLAVQR